MNIGFDLDGIFIGTPPFIPRSLLEFFYRKHGTNKLAYRFPSKFEQRIRKTAHNKSFRPVIQENVQFLKTLATKNNHKRYMITGRFGFLEDITIDLLKYHKLDKLFHAVECNFVNEQPHLFKHKVLQKHKINLYIDDDLSMLEFLAKRNKKIKFFWLNSSRNDKIKSNLFAVTQLSKIPIP